MLSSPFLKIFEGEEIFVTMALETSNSKGSNYSMSVAGITDPEDVSDEMIEYLLQKAEANLSSTSVDKLPTSQSTCASL
jgi:hypothetical protein